MGTGKSHQEFRFISSVGQGGSGGGLLSDPNSFIREYRRETMGSFLLPGLGVWVNHQVCLPLGPFPIPARDPS